MIVKILIEPNIHPIWPYVQYWKEIIALPAVLWRKTTLFTGVGGARVDPPS